MIKKSISIVTLIGIWWIAAIIVDRTVILPLPSDVFYKMFELATSSNFYISVAYTLLRVAISFLLAMILGISFGIFAGLYKNFEDFISPIITILQSIPQIAFILILLVWFRSLTALIFIVLLMLLPIFYYNTLRGIRDIDCDLIDVITLFNHPLSYTIPKVYIPLIKGYILSAIDSCLPQAFKTGVMAEIFVTTSNGIGTALYYARTQIDMVSIFSWTLWMVIIITIILKTFNYIRTKIEFRNK
ncbi:MAG: ABC transporter permease [Coprobacillaceae bacterium]